MGKTRAASLLSVFGIVVALLLTEALPVWGRDLDGRYRDSPLHDWFEHLASGKGLCCSFADGYMVEDADWETKGGHYRVRVPVAANAADAIYCGLADVHIASSKLAALPAALAACRSADDVRVQLVALASPPPAGKIEPAQPWIDACFGAEDVESIVARLADTADEAAQLSERFADVTDGPIRVLEGPLPAERRNSDFPDLARVALRFDRLSYARLRQLIDALNDLPSAPPRPAVGNPDR